MHRFSAFWLRSKCSICSYQLNIWYEDHVSSSILNLFLQGDGMSGACSGSIKSWLCIAVPQRSAHFPTFNHLSCLGRATYSLAQLRVWLAHYDNEWYCSVTRNPQVAYLSSPKHFIVKNGQNRFGKRCFLKFQAIIAHEMTGFPWKCFTISFR